jgi:hypothetical protein
MGANNVTLKNNATSMSVTGGTDLVFSEVGQTIANGVVTQAAATADFRIRETLEFKNRNPILQVDKTYSKAKRSGKILVPKILAAGTTAFNLGRWDIECHPECTAAEVLNIRLLTAQALAQAALNDFYNSGSLR